jgi:type VI secretion system secreted protein Hcp
MPIFMKLGDIKGEATDGEHKDWIPCESLSASVFLQGAQDRERLRGETTLGDVEVVRLLDEASVRLLESCANGTCFDEVEIRVCPQFQSQQPYLTYKLKNVVISGYIFFHAVATGDPPSEEITLNCTEAEWTYVVIDPNTGEQRRSVSIKYSPGGDTAEHAGDVSA